MTTSDHPFSIWRSHPPSIMSRLKKYERQKKVLCLFQKVQKWSSDLHRLKRKAKTCAVGLRLKMPSLSQKRILPPLFKTRQFVPKTCIACYVSNRRHNLLPTTYIYGGVHVNPTTRQSDSCFFAWMCDFTQILQKQKLIHFVRNIFNFLKAAAIYLVLIS